MNPSCLRVVSQRVALARQTGGVRFLVQVVDGTILVAIASRRGTVMEDGLGSANTRPPYLGAWRGSNVVSLCMTRP